MGREREPTTRSPSRSTEPERSLWISVLGAVRLEVDGVAVEVPGTRRKSVLALLAMASPDPIATDRLVDAVWPDEPPASGRSALQSHVSRIRRHLGDHGDRLENTGFGYRLALESAELDVSVASRLIDDARHAAARDPGTAARHLRTARALWRGRPLSDVTVAPDLAAWARSLDERWAEASELLVECALASDDGATAAAVAAEVVGAHPLREDAAVLLVRALAARGRPAEALREAQAFRRRLADEAGLDPSPALAEIEHEVAAGLIAAGDGGPVGAHDPRPTDGVAATTAHPGRAAAAPAVPMLGRQAELAGVMRLVDGERLVTVVGPGGVGKTRLALEVAGRVVADLDVTIVRLAPVTDEEALPDVLARALGLRADAGDPVARCALRLRTGRHLLVLDNCEHLLGPVRRLATALIETCPDLTVLATSRERLAVPAEQTCRLAPLGVPDARDPAAARGEPAVALFADRAQRVRPGVQLADDELAAVAGIVRAVDGLPLGIELAAGRLASMTVEDVAARLDRALDVVGHGSPAGAADERHRTLRAAIAWSYDLLPDHEQRLFRHLSVFADGFDLVTAEAVAEDLGLAADPAAVVAHLVDASMVVADLDLPRYRMLDSLRRFGLDRLDATGELDDAARRLRRWAVDLARWFETTADSEAEADADRRLRRELGNLHAAWTAAREARDLDAGAEIVVRLYSPAAWRDLAELWRWTLELAADDDIARHPQHAAVLACAAESAWFSSGDLDRAEALARRACDVADPDEPVGWALSRGALGDVALFRGWFEEARDLNVVAGRDTPFTAERLATAALAAGYLGDVAGARELLAAARASVASPCLRAWTRYVDGELDGLAGDWAAADAAYREAIDLADGVGASFIAGVASVGLVSALVAQDRVDEALHGYRALVDHWERTGGWTQQWTTLRNLAELLDRLGDGATAETLRGAADTAPEAPALTPEAAPPDTGASEGPVGPGAGALPDRREILDLARDAIERALAGG